MKYKKKPTVIKQVIIEDYAAEGKSLTRIEGKVYFVERTVPGDLVDIQVFKNKKDWAEAFPLYFHKYATDRVTLFVNILAPAEAVYGKCSPIRNSYCTNKNK